MPMPTRYAIALLVVVIGLMTGAVARAMFADVTSDPACEVTTQDVHLTNPAPGHADVDIYTEAGCGG